MVATQSYFVLNMSGNVLFLLPNIFSLNLERVSRKVPLDGILQGVGTLEELLALLLAERSLAGVHVLVQELPELIGQVHHLQILGEPDNDTE